MTEPLTDSEAAELRRLCEAATPGPWQANLQSALVHGPHELPVAVCWISPGAMLLSTFEAYRNNAVFVAAARNALPRLLAEREAWQVELAQMKSAFEASQGMLEKSNAMLKDVLDWHDKDKAKRDKLAGLLREAEPMVKNYAQCGACSVGECAAALDVHERITEAVAGPNTQKGR